jgi:hypothetical protein
MHRLPVREAKSLLLPIASGTCNQRTISTYEFIGKRGGPTVERLLLDPKEAPQTLNNISSHKMLIPVLINQIKADTFIDSGANKNLLNKTLVDEWKIPYREKRNLYPLNITNRRPIDSDNSIVKYKATVTLTIHSRKETITLDITNISSSDLILGIP